jgi:hypothetical protein
LFLLELSDTPDVLAETVAALSLWLQDPAQVSLRRSISAWIDRLQRRQSRRKFIPDLQEEDAMGERYVRKYETWYDAVKDQGLQAGLQRGREGRIAGMRATLKRQLAQRFGEVPPDTLAVIEGAAEAALERWLDRVLTAASPASVFAGLT